MATPAIGAGTDSQGQVPSEGGRTDWIDLNHMIEFASRMLASWPRFSDQRKAELASLLASG